MSQVVVVLAGMLVLLALFCVIVWRENSTLEEKVEQARKDRDDWRDKYQTLQEGRNSRETYLKRALEDLAFAEIDRARFALEVVYGRTKNENAVR